MERFWKCIEFAGWMLAVNILMLVSGVACLVTGNLLMNWLNGGSFALLVWSLGFVQVIIFVIIKELKPETRTRENGGER